LVKQHQTVYIHILVIDKLGFCDPFLQHTTMDSDAPLAYFVTWTVYGTHLQGAETGWRKYGQGFKQPQPLLSAWHAKHLKYSIQLLDDKARYLVELAIAKHCAIRGWHLWIANARTNHVHVVVAAAAHRGNIVRDQLKANSTRAIRDSAPTFRDRPVWTEGGDWKCVNTEEELHRVIEYVRDAQDLKGIEDNQPQGASPQLSTE